jgi:hypothetical protein
LLLCHHYAIVFFARFSKAGRPQNQAGYWPFIEKEAFMAPSPIAFCGAHPYFRAKEQCLSSRGFLFPEVWHDLHLIAADRKATVLPVAGFNSKRVEIVQGGVVLIIADYRNSGWPVLLTAFVPQNSTYAAGIIKTAATKVDVSTLVDLDARLRGDV